MTNKESSITSTENSTLRHTIKNMQAAIQIWERVYKLKRSPEANRKLKAAQAKYKSYCKTAGLTEEDIKLVNTDPSDSLALPS